MPRSGSVADIRWFDVPHTFSGHVMNAYTEGSVVHVDSTISPGNSFRFFAGKGGLSIDPGKGFATITRLSFDLDSEGGTAAQIPVAPAMGEMTRCDHRFLMQRYRYGFFKSPAGIARIAWDTGDIATHSTADAPGGGAQEPCFVPRTPESPEGDGYVISLVNRHRKNRADLVIVDTADFSGPPVATVRLPFNQPMAFHGYSCRILDLIRMASQSE